MNFCDVIPEPHIEVIRIIDDELFLEAMIKASQNIPLFIIREEQYN